jgi:pimeloyl-ACP methyl ester carboxylesterase
MKKITILFLALFIQLNLNAQDNSNSYPFKVTVKGIGKPVILIPGLSCSGEVWDETVEILQSNYECHILTLPGFSDQKPIDAANGFLPLMKDKIIQYIKNNFNEKPIIIGHSLGGFLALLSAIENDELFKKIIIVDSYPFMSAAFNPAATEENMISQADMVKKMITESDDSVYSYQQAISIGTMITNPDKINTALQWSLQSNRKTIAQAMFELMITDLRSKLSYVKTPMLVLGSWIGGKDFGITKESVLAQFETQYKMAENVKIKVADSAKHFIMWDDFDWFINEIIPFMKDGK